MAEAEELKVEEGAEGAEVTAFSRELDSMLKQRGLTWRKLANLVEYTPSWLSKVKHGAQPSAELARRCDEVLEASGRLIALAEAEGVAGAVRPAQLPAVTAGFTGRAQQLAVLREVLTGDVQVGAPRLAAIDGPPGAGKTTLALRCAHELAAQFPDGQLYVDLLGFSSVGRPKQAAEALEDFLLALAVPSRGVPSSVAQRAALYRSLLATRRVLVVLDNAADVGQLEPLLPASAECAVLVTSRSHLLGLGVRAGARRVTVGPMSAEESVALLHRVIGRDRLHGQQESVRELARQCAYLPLALRIAAERVVTGIGRGVAEVITQLATEGLNLLTIDETTAVRGVFSWSYRALPGESARMFRLLSLHPGQQISASAAGALARASADETKRMIDTLVDAHLLAPVGEDRYQLHELIRRYADERACAEDTPAGRARAVRRLVEWYLRTAVAAGRQLAPYRVHLRALALPETDTGSTSVFSDVDAALRWCESEVRSFVAVSRLALEHGAEDLAWKLPLALFDYFLLRKPWSVWLAADEIALSAAELTGERRAEGWVRANLAVAHFWQGDFDRSHELCAQALAISSEVGDRHGQAWASYGLARVCCQQGRNEQAHDHAQRALGLFERLGERDGQAAALATLGEVHRSAGRWDSALSTTQRALRLCEEQRDHSGRGRKLVKMAEIYLARGDRDKALHYLSLSLVARREADDRWGEADTHFRRGNILHDLGRTDLARGAWQAALDLFDELGDPRTADVAARLAAAS